MKRGHNLARSDGLHGGVRMKLLRAVKDRLQLNFRCYVAPTSISASLLYHVLTLNDLILLQVQHFSFLQRLKHPVHIGPRLESELPGQFLRLMLLPDYL
jgi:hypothetical protein